MSHVQGQCPPTYDPGQGQYAVVATPNESWESHGASEPLRHAPTTHHGSWGLPRQKGRVTTRRPDQRTTYSRGHELQLIYIYMSLHMRCHKRTPPYPAGTAG